MAVPILNWERRPKGLVLGPKEAVEAEAKDVEVLNGLREAGYV